jgi:hypothetical protein
MTSIIEGMSSSGQANTDTPATTTSTIHDDVGDVGGDGGGDGDVEELQALRYMQQEWAPLFQASTTSSKVQSEGNGKKDTRMSKENQDFVEEIAANTPNLTCRDFFGIFHRFHMYVSLTV